MFSFFPYPHQHVTFCLFAFLTEVKRSFFQCVSALCSPYEPMIIRLYNCTYVLLILQVFFHSLLFPVLCSFIVECNLVSFYFCFLALGVSFKKLLSISVLGSIFTIFLYFHNFSGYI